MLGVSLLMGWGALSAHVSAAQVGFAATGRLTGLGSGKIWSVAVEPSLPSTILAGTDAGVYVSRDTGATWIRTLGGLRVWTVGFDARTPSNAFAGTDGKGVYASADVGERPGRTPRTGSATSTSGRSRSGSTASQRGPTRGSP